MVEAKTSRLTMSVETFINPTVPCFGRAEECRRVIRRIGAESRIIYDGNGVPNLNSVLDRSLLGLRLGRRVNLNEFTSSERMLSGVLGQGGECKVLTITDFDGVFVSPAHTLHEVVNGVFNGEIAIKKAFGEAKERGKISQKTALAFARIIKASDLTIFWSSRFYLSDETLQKVGPLRKLAEPFRGPISYFPFIDDDTVRRLERLGKDKLLVVPNKPIGSAGEDLAGMIEKVGPDITYYIGSSERDREVVESMLNSHLYLANRFVFFDAGHFIF